MAHGCARAHAGGVRSDASAACAFSGAAGRHVAGADGGFSGLGQYVGVGRYGRCPGQRCSCRCAAEGRAGPPMVRDVASVRGWQRAHCASHRGSVSGALRWQHGTFLQLVGADRARAQGVLRHPGADAEGQHGCDGLAVLVSGHVGTDAGQCACNAGCGADEGTLLAALGQYPDESAADQAAEPASGRLRRQAHQQPLGQHGQVLAGYGAA